MLVKAEPFWLTFGGQRHDSVGQDIRAAGIELGVHGWKGAQSKCQADSTAQARHGGSGGSKRDGAQPERREKVNTTGDQPPRASKRRGLCGTGA